MPPEEVEHVGEFNQSEYANDYNRKNYDRVNIMVPKGRREAWKEAAAARGLSMNALVNEAVETKIKTEFPELEKPDT